LIGLVLFQFFEIPLIRIIEDLAQLSGSG